MGSGVGVEEGCSVATGLAAGLACVVFGLGLERVA